VEEEALYMPEQWVGLAEAIRALREELTTAIETAKGEVLRFGLGPVEMEFLLEVKKDAGGQAGVRFGVISLGAKGRDVVGIDASSEVVLDTERRTGAVPFDVRQE
jgi:hypothetical protein